MTPRRPSNPPREPAAEMLFWPAERAAEFERRVAALVQLGHAASTARAVAFEQLRTTGGQRRSANARGAAP